ncbi:VWA domain-containing protein [candidate division KSB1 bacterium]
MHKTRIIVLFISLFLLIKPTILCAQENPIILIILDCSKSMYGSAGKTTKFQKANEIIYELLNKKEHYAFGLLTFGNNYTDNPDDIELIIVPFANNKSKILAELHNIQPKGLSPIGKSLDLAGKILKKGLKNYIILISDGTDNCGGNPILSAKNLLKSKSVQKIHTISFDTTQSKIQLLKNTAEAGNGSYFSADNYTELFNSLYKPIQYSEYIETTETIRTKANISYKSFLEKEGGFPAFGSEIKIINSDGEVISNNYQWKGIIEDVIPGNYTLVANHQNTEKIKEITLLENQIAYESFTFDSETGGINYINFVQGSREIMAYGTTIKIMHSNGETVYTGNKWEGTIEHLPVGKYDILAYNSGITLQKEDSVRSGEITNVEFEFPLQTGQITYQCFLDSAMQKPAYGIILRILKLPGDELVYEENTRWRGTTPQIPVGDYTVSGMLLGKVQNEKVVVNPNTTTFYDLIFNIQQVRLVYECYRNTNNDPANGAQIAIIDAQGNEIEKSMGWRGSFVLPVGNYDIIVTFENAEKRQRVNLMPTMSDTQEIKIYLSE